MYFWKRVKEEWPYFKSHPIRWIKRKWMLRKIRPATKKMLDIHGKYHDIFRLLGETDNEFRIRILNSLKERREHAERNRLS